MMPKLHLGFGVHYFATTGFTLTGMSEDTQKEIESLNKSMTGGPSDADRYYRLSQLDKDRSDYTKASNTLVRAIELYRKQVDTQPGNAELLARFGRALGTAEKDGEAEAVLRRAVKIDPKDWRCWSALGRFLNARFGSHLFEGESTNTRSFADVLAQASVTKIPGVRVEEAQKYLEEALACANRAIDLAPREPQPYEDRALCSCNVSVLHFVKDSEKGLPGDPIQYYRTIFPTNAVPDLWRMADLMPEDPSAITKAAFFEVWATIFQTIKRPDQVRDGNLLGHLSEDRQKSFRRGLTRLENLGQSANKQISARALEFLGALQSIVMRDQTRAEGNLRRAVAIDPSRELAWDLLMSILKELDRPTDAVATAEARLKTKESTFNRIAAAKACDQLGRLDKAQTHVEAALKITPDDYTVNFSAAIVLVKRSTDEDSIRRAKEFIERASKASGHPASKDEWIHWTLTSGIMAALEGYSEIARSAFKRVIDIDPENETAKRALQLMQN